MTLPSPPKLSNLYLVSLKRSVWGRTRRGRNVEPSSIPFINDTISVSYLPIQPPRASFLELPLPLKEVSSSSLDVYGAITASVSALNLKTVMDSEIKSGLFWSFF